MKNRIYSLLIPWFLDGSLALVQTAMPLLALQLGAGDALLGTIGAVGQAARLPICFTSGQISEKVGRVAIIVPAGLILAVAAVALGLARGNLHIIIFYSLAIAALGTFYPPLQAMIGDISRRGELRKNLGAFNMGWCVGGAVAAAGAHWLIRHLGLRPVFFIAAVGCIISATLVLSWRGKRVDKTDPADEDPTPREYSPSLLLISRMGLFTGFFGLAAIRMLFPKLGQTMGWSDAKIAGIVAFALIGQGVGMIAANASPWWRGKLWPQVVAQIVMLASGVGIALFSIPEMLALCLFAEGCALSIAYTGALYYGLSAPSARGRSTGLHESIAAASSISGSFIGGIAAQFTSPRAPYVLLACLAGACLIWTARCSGNRRTLVP